ncbi:MAG: precorrin-6y C5,15-methyltransferase (decarboxylating) subunit CbiE [Cocleimonas sp.]|nr:precorrin-6y C5,15-methyltransferase (decarboxylating) subunit CbiE [Cocleimonas sp.]
MIHVVGLGLGHRETLSNNALHAIHNAALIIGSQRQLSCVLSLLNDVQEQRNYPSPFVGLSTQLSTYLATYPTNKICLLASGDPLFYGISDFLLRHFSTNLLTFYSNTSSIQTAFARIKKPWQQAKTISLHGRPLSNLIPHLANNPLVALLTDKHSHPQAIANLLCTYGYDEAKLWVCETLGSKDEKVSLFIAKELANSTQHFHPLHITIVETKVAHCTLPSFAGFQDELFITDTDQAGRGMISKREVRLTALSLLQPKANDIAWDIGAGCGTIAVEWAYWNQQGTLYAVEHHTKRLACLKKNKQKFGVNNLQIIADKAPDGLNDLPQPNAIFIGGTAGKLSAIMDTCWSSLLTGGCLVINCVTENCKADLQHWLQQQDIADEMLEWTEIAVSKGGQLAGQLLMRPRLPVRLLKIVKD